MKQSKFYHLYVRVKYNLIFLDPVYFLWIATNFIGIELEHLICLSFVVEFSVPKLS